MIGGTSATSPQSIVLTDSPEVVALKAEFRRLDTREQELKQEMGARAFAGFDWPELETVREAKRQIAVKIFNA